MGAGPAHQDVRSAQHSVCVAWRAPLSGQCRCGGVQGLCGSIFQARRWLAAPSFAPESEPIASRAAARVTVCTSVGVAVLSVHIVAEATAGAAIACVWGDSRRRSSHLGQRGAGLAVSAQGAVATRKQLMRCGWSLRLPLSCNRPCAGGRVLAARSRSVIAGAQPCRCHACPCRAALPGPGASGHARSCGSGMAGWAMRTVACAGLAGAHWQQQTGWGRPMGGGSGPGREGDLGARRPCAGSPHPSTRPS